MQLTQIPGGSGVVAVVVVVEVIFDHMSDSATYVIVVNVTRCNFYHLSNY